MSAKKSLKILFFGDIVAKLGRKTIATVLPELKKKYQPDVIIGNVENLAHGKGVTIKTLTELKDLGFDIFTAGNHVWSKDDPSSKEMQKEFQLALPANNELTPQSQKWQTIEVGEHKLFVLNLLTREGIDFEGTSSPFHAFDQLYHEMGEPKLLLVDFHAEITSERIVFGWYLDGRASAVVGTHTHVATADARILTKGTGYITDVGMVGARDESLGVDKKIVLQRFLENEIDNTFVWVEDGPVTTSAVYLEIDVKTGKCKKIKQIIKHLNNI